MGYSDPDFTIRREACMPPTTAGATTEGSKFRSFQKMRLKKAHAAVVVAGTATTHAYTIKNGTTSVGLITLSTNVAGVEVSSGVINSTVEAMDQVSATSGADATGTAQIVYEFEVLPDAVKS